MTRSTDKAIRKYLAGHAEPEAARLLDESKAPQSFGHVLCVPSYGEGQSLLRSLETVPGGALGEVLILVIVNETDESPAWVKDANVQTLSALREALAPGVAPSPLQWFPHPRGSLLLVDRTRTGTRLPDGQGVGLARKIGADMALALWTAGRIQAPWIHCSDADVAFPADYFDRAPSTSTDTAALLYDFCHVHDPDPEVALAALRYELFLRYYVLGLRSAGSPYAFHTIGSTVTVAPGAYAQARGFPRRKAAEDFHLLAKLAKLGAVRSLPGEPLRLSGRVSARVPFGTGAGIAKELERVQAGERYPTYDPHVFQWLGVWLRTLARLSQEPRESRHSVGDLLQVEASAAGVDFRRLHSLLDELGAIAAAEAGRERGQRHLHERFDALRTLRFIHELRDRHLPPIPLEHALGEAPFLDLNRVKTRDDLEAALRHLVELEATPSSAPSPASA